VDVEVEAKRRMLGAGRGHSAAAGGPRAGSSGGTWAHGKGGERGDYGGDQLNVL
jgi:hypothetical protein